MKFYQVALACAAASAFASVPATAATTIFAEHFNDSEAFKGTTLVEAGTAEGTSDRFGLTTYSNILNGNGWTFSGVTALDAQNASATDGALLLNENSGTASRILSGLTAGAVYSFSFLLSGDNRPGQTYGLNGSIDGNPFFSVLGVGLRSGTSPGTPYSFSFMATGASAALQLTQANISQASPIIDNIVVAAVPEPATWAMMLLGFGIIGFGLRQRRTKVTVSYA